MHLGTLEWGHATCGRLRPAERRRLVAQGIVAVVRARLPGARAYLPSSLARPPQTSFARRADELLEATSPPWLVHHARRSYVWAMALAERDDLRVDAELLYAACQLHDLGLVESYAPAAGECFALSGAKGAEEAMLEAGMPARRARIVGEAIALHLNLVVELERHGPEAHLLRAATALDVAGQDVERIGRAFRDATLAEFPRLDFKRELIDSVRAQAERSPSTRIGFLCRTLKLPARIASAPFPS